VSRFCSLRRQGPFIGFWKSASPAANSKSVPVLPFENFSDSKENSYFSDGLMSEVNFAIGMFQSNTRRASARSAAN
jgi:TolB-like protein